LGFRDILKISFLKPRKKFRLFQVEPTMTCNLNCVMCPWTSLRKPNSHMEWEVFAAIARYFQDTEEVDLTGGGESLLHPRLEEMVRLAKASGCVVGFSTNGTLLGPEKAGRLLAADLDWIAYSVEGATAETYEKIRVGASFKKVIENIAGLQRLKEKRGDGKPKTMLFFVMMKENIQELPTMIGMAHSLGIDHVVAKNLDVILNKGDDRKRVFKHPGEGEIALNVSQAVMEAQRRAEDLRMPLRVYELFPAERSICEQDPLNTLFVAWDGFVSPCINLSYIRERSFGGRWQTCHTRRFGNIVDEPLAAIWEKAEYRDFRKLFQERRDCSSGSVAEFLAPNLQGYRETSDWPAPPRGCETCYYLHGV
jgi:MoaA/NifB/PqqE/SkfB family radical SAM enzyme